MGTQQADRQLSPDRFPIRHTSCLPQDSPGIAPPLTSTPTTERPRTYSMKEVVLPLLLLSSILQRQQQSQPQPRPLQPRLRPLRPPSLPHQPPLLSPRRPPPLRGHLPPSLTLSWSSREV